MRKRVRSPDAPTDPFAGTQDNLVAKRSRSISTIARRTPGMAQRADDLERQHQADGVVAEEPVRSRACEKMRLRCSAMSRPLRCAFSDFAETGVDAVDRRPSASAFGQFVAAVLRSHAAASRTDRNAVTPDSAQRTRRPRLARPRWCRLFVSAHRRSTESAQRDTGASGSPAGCRSLLLARTGSARLLRAVSDGTCRGTPSSPGPGAPPRPSRLYRPPGWRSPGR